MRWSDGVGGVGGMLIADVAVHGDEGVRWTWFMIFVQDLFMSCIVYI
jgi:hypothetical protein